LYVPLPDRNGRHTIVTNLLKTQVHSLTEDQLEAICDKTDGYSGADMDTLCREAAYGPINGIADIASANLDDVRPISFEDFTYALTQVKPSVSPKDLEIHIEFNKLYGMHFTNGSKLHYHIRKEHRRTITTSANGVKVELDRGTDGLFTSLCGRKLPFTVIFNHMLRCKTCHDKAHISKGEQRKDEEGGCAREPSCEATKQAEAQSVPATTTAASYEESRNARRLKTLTEVSRILNEALAVLEGMAS
ncbi:putative 26S proteasome subunit yta6, partial [Dipsacomyces acuminosporus]